MNWLGFSYGASVACYLLAPFALGWWLKRRRGGAWWLFGAGALTFLTSQLVHLPLLQLVGLIPMRPPRWLIRPLNGAILGLAAGLCEEWARYLTFRVVVPARRGFRDALSVGAGHGGIEAVMLGLLLGSGLVSGLAFERAGLASLGLSPQQLALAQARLDAAFNIPAYLPLVGVVERAVVIPYHLAMSTLVAHGVRAGRHWPVWLAVLVHTLLDAAVVYLDPRNPALPMAAYYAATALSSAAVIYWMSRLEDRP